MGRAFFSLGPAPTGLYARSLHDALPILHVPAGQPAGLVIALHGAGQTGADQSATTNYNAVADQIGSTRLNSSHVEISYAVFCLKKKNISPDGSQLAWIAPREGVMNVRVV